MRWRLASAAVRARALAARTWSEFFDDGCPQRAAAIAYYALLSLFPLVILVVAVLSRALHDEGVRSQVIEFVLDHLPLRPGRGRAELRGVLESVTAHAAGFGAAGLIGLLVAASGVMGAIRLALNAAWDVRDPRPPLQGKAIDLLLVLGFGIAVAASFALTVVGRLTVSAAGAVGGAVGVGSGPSAIVAWSVDLLPILLSMAIFAVLFAIVPAALTRPRHTWPGVVLAALGFEAAKTLFAVYLDTFSRYDVIYASLSTIVAFLVFVYVAALILLVGAEAASEWPGVRAASVAELSAPGAPLAVRVREALKRLVARPASERSDRRGS